MIAESADKTLKVNLSGLENQGFNQGLDKAKSIISGVMKK